MEIGPDRIDDLRVAGEPFWFSDWIVYPVDCEAVIVG